MQRFQQSTVARRAAASGHFLFLPAVALILSACTTTHYKESADKEVYQILAEKSPAVPGMVEDVDIKPHPAVDLSTLARIEQSYEFMGTDVNEVGASVLSLERALEIAFTHSRDYQTRKEQLYLQALRLTLDRHEFAPIFSADVSARHIWDSEDVVSGDLLRAVDTMAGPPGQLLKQYADTVSSSGVMTRGVSPDLDVERTTAVEVDTSVGFNMLLKGGGRIAADITSNFFKFLSGGSGESAASLLSATFVQPLLRGAGRDVTMEFLTQSERDVLYELRSFTDFRREFAVRVASQYYTVLRARDAVSNNYRGLKSFEKNLEREQAFQKEGLKTAADVARLVDSKLQREASWNNLVRGYLQAIDNFKILLGIPTDTLLILDDAELLELRNSGVAIPAVTSDQALQVALATRLDLFTQHDVVEDTERRIKVAANALKPGLDLVLTGDVASRDGNRFASFDFDRSVWTAGANLELPLDRKSERNNYVAALINHEVALRDASLAEDNVKLDVRNAYRNLVQAQKDYEISQSSLQVNKSRVEEVTLRAELGLGDILAQVDAQNALTEAESDVTGAIVDFHISLLEFWRDLGILYVKENGTWEEIKDV